MKNTVHFTLQGKGGIGKTFVSSILAQYINKNYPDTLKCLDTDQENTTFSRYKALCVEHVKVMNDNEHTISRVKFDDMIELILSTTDRNIVIDNGANTFSPLLSYLVVNKIIEILKDNEKTVYIHTIIGGGDNLTDTSEGYSTIVDNISCNTVVWLNEFFGSTEKFIASDKFKKNKNVVGTVLLQKRDGDMFGPAIQKMNTARLTFDETQSSDDFRFMEKTRIRNFANDVYEKLDMVFVF